MKKTDTLLVSQSAFEDLPEHCRCGSGQFRYALVDKADRFSSYVCALCEDEVREAKAKIPEFIDDIEELYEVTK